MIGEAARLLGVSVHRVRQLESSGQIAAFRTTGRVRLFKRSDVVQLAAERHARLGIVPA